MVRRHWRDPGYWRWFWRKRVASEVKVVAGAVLIALTLGGGWLAADRLASANAGANPAGVLTVATTVQKVVTVREKGKIVRKLVPVVRKVFVTGPTAFKTTTAVRTRVVTASRGVRTVRTKLVVHVPVVSTKEITVNGKKETVVVTRLVPTTKTETQRNTITQTRTQTQVQTSTLTMTQTVTQPVTTTQTVTVNQKKPVPPVTVTVTVTT